MERTQAEMETLKAEMEAVLAKTRLEAEDKVRALEKRLEVALGK